MRQNQYNESITSEGSSPLRTFQALIWEEIALRNGEAGNFVTLMLNDIINFISLPIYITDDVMDY